MSQMKTRQAVMCAPVCQHVGFVPEVSPDRHGSSFATGLQLNLREISKNEERRRFSRKEMESKVPVQLLY
eukprot:scaffold189523_cov30-Attheya_sp.AAC.1